MAVPVQKPGLWLQDPVTQLSGPHDVPADRKPFAGQLALEPEQVSAGSQKPVELRH